MFSLKTPIPKPPLQKNLPNFNWTMFMLLIVAPILVLPAFAISLFFHSSWLFYLAVFVVTYAMCVLSIGVYHRYWTHRSFAFKKTGAGKVIDFLVRLYGAVVGILAGEGDALSWVLRHWKHHLLEDKAGEDHHTPNEFESKFWGFVWSHVGWMCYISPSKFDFENHSNSKRKELESDPLVRWQYKYYVPLYILFATAFPVVLGLAFSDAFWAWTAGAAFSYSILWDTALMFLAINSARLCCQHATFFVNSLCHMFGSKPYKNFKTGDARDNWLVAILVFGEGYHNGHHAFGFSYEHGIRHAGNKGKLVRPIMYMLDIHARIIDTFDTLGLLEYKLKPSDEEVAMVSQKTVLFDLEAQFESLRLEFNRRRAELKGQFSIDLNALREKLSASAEEYKQALLVLIEKLQAVLVSCKERMSKSAEGSIMLAFWEGRYHKAEKELKMFQKELALLA